MNVDFYHFFWNIFATIKSKSHFPAELQGFLTFILIYLVFRHFVHV
ncbi:hypothetical protein SHD_3244 [Shewanella decolorationis S12]|uniref:Uncharacterized protein n=1 Tax=Shewanella decolorationis S12 TaxID=1353536 RepID=A0ABP2Z0L7_9GAMM|nr:hypothetical protein SHD_3244 [Shewanella decolorationis S12]